jgi:iron uptake system component EfeO
VSTDGRLIRPRQKAWATGAVLALAAAAAACSSSSGPSGSTASSKTSKVTIELTPQGCMPKPAKISAGQVDFTVANKDADAVSEAELRTADMSRILAEQENLSPGLSGGFSLNVQPGSYKISCPGAAQSRWTFTVSGRAAGPVWQSDSQLTAAVRGYSGYIGQNAAALVSHTQSFCRAIEAGDMAQAKLQYPQARVFYEHIEPVAEIWGTLDTQIDGRWENPVTVPSKFMGFHKIEQLIWSDNTLAGTRQLCTGLVQHEQQLDHLVSSAQYSPLEMASGATDLINEAATSKISGEEERYSDTDLPVFQANVDGAMEIVALLRPYLQQKDSSLLALIQRRDAAVAKLMTTYKATPGYDATGYVEYSTVLDNQRRQLAASVSALAEALSKVSSQVS